MILQFISFFLVILSVVEVTDQKKIAQIIKGISTKQRTYHYVVAIVKVLRQQSIVTANPYCTGSLISPKWVLTAAHCLQFDPKDVKNRAVTYDAIKGTIVKRMLKVAFHPQYLSFYYENLNDIGLVLTERIDSKMLGRVSNADYLSLIGKSVLYVGNGLNNTDYDVVRDYMKIKLTKNSKKISDQTLPRLYRAIAVKCDSSKRFARGTICVRPKCWDFNQRLKRGAGGPLLYRERIVGVGSAVGGPFCFATPVSPHIDWIAEVMSNHSRKIAF